MTECSAILFHATKKKYLEDILTDGLRPGSKEGIFMCALTEEWRMSELGEYTLITERKLCDKYVFMSGNIESIESFISIRPEFDIILLICLPIDMVTVGTWKNFKEYRDYKISEYLKKHPEEKDIYPEHEGYIYLSEIWEIRVDNIIDPKYIIGYLEIKRRTKDANDWTYDFIKI